MTFDPNLVMWHKWGGQPVLVTKSGQNRSGHVRDISQRSVDRRRKKKKKKLDLETDLDTVASVTSNDPRLTFDPIK